MAASSAERTLPHIRAPEPLQGLLSVPGHAVVCITAEALQHRHGLGSSAPCTDVAQRLGSHAAHSRLHVLAGANQGSDHLRKVLAPANPA